MWVSVTEFEMASFDSFEQEWFCFFVTVLFMGLYTGLGRAAVKIVSAIFSSAIVMNSQLDFHPFINFLFFDKILLLKKEVNP